MASYVIDAMTSDQEIIVGEGQGDDPKGMNLLRAAVT
jgi:hypothetical protein